MATIVKGTYVQTAKKAAEFAADITTIWSKNQLLIEEDTLKMKVGDGINVFSQLKYATVSPTEVQKLIADSSHSHINKAVLDQINQDMVERMKQEAVTPIANVKATDDGAEITITDYKGTTKAEIKNGKVPSTLPNPNKLTLSGLVTAEYDGSSEVSVHIPEPCIFDVANLTDVTSGHSHLEATLSYSVLHSMAQETPHIYARYLRKLYPLYHIDDLIVPHRLEFVGVGEKIVIDANDSITQESIAYDSIMGITVIKQNNTYTLQEPAPIEFLNKFVTNIALIMIVDQDSQTSQIFQGNLTNVSDGLITIIEYTCINYNTIIKFIFKFDMENEDNPPTVTVEQKPIVPAALPNPNKLTFEGAVTAEYDGSSAVTIDLSQLSEDLSHLSEENVKLKEEKVNNPSIGEIGQILQIETVDENGKPKTYKAVDKPTGGGEVSPQWGEFPRLTNPARDIYNASSMENKKILGTDGTLRHNMMIHGALITWTESTGSVDYADSSGSASVKLCGWYDKFGISYKDRNSNIIYTDVSDVFPSGTDIYGVDGTVIDTVVASSDSTIIDLGSNNYIIMAGCQGASSYHMIYREVNYVASRTITLGDAINVLTIGGVEWDMTTLREDYFNKYSQLNTKVIKNGNYYYMAMVQSGVGIAIMKSSDGKEWSLHHHIPDIDCHLEACIGCVTWVSNNQPTVYVVVRHKYGDGYITLYGFKNINTMDLLTKTFIPASTGRALLDSVNNKDIYLAYSVNGRKNAVLAQILPNSDGTTGVSILETPREVMSNYPTLFAHRSSAGTYFIMFGGTDGLNKSGSSISCAYLWNENNDVLKEKNEQLKKVMFGTSVEVVQTLTEGTEIGSVGGTKLYAPYGGSEKWETVLNETTTEEKSTIQVTFDSAKKIKKIKMYVITNGTATNTAVDSIAFGFNGSAIVYIAIGKDAIQNTADTKRYVYADVEVFDDCCFGVCHVQQFNGDIWPSTICNTYRTNLKTSTDVNNIVICANKFANKMFGVGTQAIVKVVYA